jgi:hypothetical protein
MWKPWQWPVTSNERAVLNARVAAIECSRRRVESAEVQLFLDQLTPAQGVGAGVSQHPA